MKTVIGKYLSKIDLDKQEIEKREIARRKLWDYRKIDRIPVIIWLTCNPHGYSMRELLTNEEKQLEANIVAVYRSSKCMDDDYIPWLRPDVGYMTMATVYGSQVFWGDNPDQMPSAGPPIYRRIEQITHIPEFDPIKRGLMSHCLNRIHYFRKETKDAFYLSGVDLGGPLNTAKDLLENQLLYLSFYEHSQELHKFLDRITKDMIQCWHAIVKESGGSDRMTTTDFDPTWAPEQYKGFVSDDIAATVSPGTWKEFGRPYNSEIYAHFGGGLLHNCGPNPSYNEYLDHSPNIKGLNCSYECSKNDFCKLKTSFAGMGLIFPMFDQGESLDEMYRDYEQIISIFAPTTLCVPICIIDGEQYKDEDIKEFYQKMKSLSYKYAQSMNWRS